MFGRHGILLLLFSLVFVANTKAQQKDSVLIFYKDSAFYGKPNQPINWKKVKTAQGDQDMTFSGTRIAQTDEDKFDSTGTITLGGYVSCYYGYYSDSSYRSGYQKFPTSAPQSNTFSLNIVQLSAKYESRNFRGIFTFHYGDIPQSCWSPNFNNIQEANAGFRLAKKVWLDAGFFRTHLGVESIQPRENITYSIATTTYFEPYFLSGAKLTWETTSKLTLQANIFNSFNTFNETNKNKALGFSALYEANDHFSITYNMLHCDESPLYAPLKKPRLYNNLYFVYRSKHLDMGAEFNYGTQQHTKLNDSTATAQMMSALLALKYKINKKFALYARGEYFYDPDEILTGPVEDIHHKLIGINLSGITAGFELKPIPNSYVRLEGRLLQTTGNEKIFEMNGASSNQRFEVLTGIGVWF